MPSMQTTTKPSSARAWLSPWAARKLRLPQDGIFFAGVEVDGLPEEAVERGLAVAAFDGDRSRRLPAGGEQFGDVLSGDFHHLLALEVADHGDLRLGDGGISVDEVGAFVG
jgi:hypothetical protein